MLNNEHAGIAAPSNLAPSLALPPPEWVRPRAVWIHACALANPCVAAEKRPSIEGLVDNMEPRDSHSTELQELPKYEAPEEQAGIPLKEQLITSFWILVNTISTLGLVFLSKQYASTPPTYPALFLTTV